MEIGPASPAEVLGSGAHVGARAGMEHYHEGIGKDAPADKAEQGPADDLLLDPAVGVRSDLNEEVARLLVPFEPGFDQAVGKLGGLHDLRLQRPPRADGVHAGRRRRPSPWCSMSHLLLRSHAPTVAFPRRRVPGPGAFLPPRAYRHPGPTPAGAASSRGSVRTDSGAAPRTSGPGGVPAQ